MTPPDSILLVEDDWQIREFVCIALESEGYTVHEASTAGHGAVQAGSIRPALLILPGPAGPGRPGFHPGLPGLVLGPHPGALGQDPGNRKGEGPGCRRR